MQPGQGYALDEQLRRESFPDAPDKIYASFFHAIHGIPMDPEKQAKAFALEYGFVFRCTAFGTYCFERPIAETKVY